MGGGNFGNNGGNNNHHGQGGYGTHQGGFGKFGGNNNPSHYNNTYNNNPNKPIHNTNNFPKGDEFQSQFCRNFHFGEPCKFNEKCSRKHAFDL